MTLANLNIERSRPVEPKAARSRVTVCVKESATEAWKEETDIISVSRTGAGFTLSRPCSVGRLVLLKTSIPRELRVYDHEAPIYSIIGLVQFCHPVSSEGTTVYNLGVGFTGNVTPNSFKKDPRQNYRITGARPDGLWQIKEVASEFKKRKRPRITVQIPVLITVVSDSERTLTQQNAFTANVSIGGASVMTTLQGKIGEKVKFACDLLNFYSMAVIRGIEENESRPNLLHLQFLDAEFPVDKMLTGHMRYERDAERLLSYDGEFFYF